VVKVYLYGTFTVTSTPTVTATSSKTSTPTITPTVTVETIAASTLTPTVEVTTVSALKNGSIDVYPLPARDQVCIRLGLEQESEVEVGIFDVAGERIALLRDTVLPGGWLVWNCRTAAPGIYLARIHIKSQKTVVRKIAIIR